VTHERCTRDEQCRTGTVALSRRGAFRCGAESEIGDSLRPRWAALTDSHTELPRPCGEELSCLRPTQQCQLDCLAVIVVRAWRSPRLDGVEPRERLEVRQAQVEVGLIEPAIDLEHLARHVCRSGRREVDHRGGDVVGLAEGV
jgi:hypothetical protein